MWMPSMRKKEDWASAITAEAKLTKTRKQNTAVNSNKQLLLAFCICLFGFEFILSGAFEFDFSQFSLKLTAVNNITARYELTLL